MRPSEYRRTVKALVRLALADAPAITCDEATHGSSGTEVCGRTATVIVETDGYGNIPCCARCATYYHWPKRGITDSDRVDIIAAYAEQQGDV
jgi:hypothetical protein